MKGVFYMKNLVRFIGFILLATVVVLPVAASDRSAELEGNWVLDNDEKFDAGGFGYKTISFPSELKTKFSWIEFSGIRRGRGQQVSLFAQMLSYDGSTVSAGDSDTGAPTFTFTVQISGNKLTVRGLGRVEDANLSIYNGTYTKADY
jgi:hypothetical protein